MSPFTDRAADSVASLGETALLRAIRTWLGDVAPPSPAGMGDDCAVIDSPKSAALLATTDGVVHGRHFDDSAAPAAVGAKLLKRNVSDIAAMGGSPTHALLNLFLARNTATGWLQDFYTGLAAVCRPYGVLLVGGDLAQAPAGVFAAHLTLLGTASPRVLTRTGGQVGDHLFVTGELGGSILGKHLDFTPRLPEGQWLAGQPGVRCLIDVTDGLAKDLPELLPPGTDARLDSVVIPVALAARELAARDGSCFLRHALTDGEDYELLFALDGSVSAPAFLALWRQQFSTPLTRIGAIAAAPEFSSDPHRQLRDATTGAPLLPPDAHGYEHLRPQE